MIEHLNSFESDETGAIIRMEELMRDGLREALGQAKGTGRSEALLKMS